MKGKPLAPFPPCLWGQSREGLCPALQRWVTTRRVTKRGGRSWAYCPEPQSLGPLLTISHGSSHFLRELLPLLVKSLNPNSLSPSDNPLISSLCSFHLKIKILLISAERRFKQLFSLLGSPPKPRLPQSLLVSQRAQSRYFPHQRKSPL